MRDDHRVGRGGEDQRLLRCAHPAVSAAAAGGGGGDPGWAAAGGDDVAGGDGGRVGGVG